MRMPQVNLETLKCKLSESDYAIAQRVVARGRIRSTKPTGNDYISRCAQYVWRMVVFHVSPNPYHQMFPAMAFFYMPENSYTDAGQRLLNRLNNIVDEIEELIPKTEWHGIQRWGEALGIL